MAKMSEQESGDHMTYVKTLALAAKDASIALALADSFIKNRCLSKIADLLAENQNNILEANQQDISLAKQNNLNDGLIDRLTLTPKRIIDMIQGIHQVMELSDPINELINQTVRPNGMILRQVRVPLGLIGMIYESRPNVTIDATVLCLKSGNAVVLRGGKETIHTNKVLVSLIKQALENTGLPAVCVQLIEDPDRAHVMELMQLHGIVDVLIPRGGAGLIRNVIEYAKVPVLETGTGNNHVYVDKEADLDMAVSIVRNAKTSRVSVCNAIESLLVHKAIAESFLPNMVEAMKDYSMTLYGCEVTKIYIDCLDASDDLFATEFLDYALAIKVVENIDEAIRHIARYGTKHSECIVSTSEANIAKFQLQVDAACVYANASTRFSDGGEFGLGCEIGISTQKMHARGPMGLHALTTYKYLIVGNGQVR